MSLTGSSGGVAIDGLSERELRTVMYLVGYPNLLVSLHPDYVMTHLMTPLAVDRTHVECVVGLPERGRRASRLRPVLRRRLLGPHQPAGLGGVRVGAARPAPHPHARPGPLAPDEDGVYQFVTRVARAYRRRPLTSRGHPVDPVGRLRVGADGEGHRGTGDAPARRGRRWRWCRAVCGTRDRTAYPPARPTAAPAPRSCVRRTQW